jgi:hypothetical protein
MSSTLTEKRISSILLFLLSSTSASVKLLRMLTEIIFEGTLDEKLFILDVLKKPFLDF